MPTVRQGYQADLPKPTHDTGDGGVVTEGAQVPALPPDVDIGTEMAISGGAGGHAGDRAEDWFRRDAKRKGMTMRQYALEMGMVTGYMQREIERREQTIGLLEHILEGGCE